MSSNILKKHLSYSQCVTKTAPNADVTIRRKDNGIRKQNKSVLVNKKTTGAGQFTANKSYLELATDGILDQQEQYAKKLKEYSNAKPIAKIKNKKGQKTNKASRKQINNILKLHKKI